MLSGEGRAASEAVPIPKEILLASQVPWGVFVDAYLTEAVKVGDRYAGLAYLDQSGLIPDSSTVATPPVKTLQRKHDFVLVQALSGLDHYVIAALQVPEECDA